MYLERLIRHLSHFRPTFFTIFRGGQAKQLWNIDNFIFWREHKYELMMLAELSSQLKRNFFSNWQSAKYKTLFQNKHYLLRELGSASIVNSYLWSIIIGHLIGPKHPYLRGHNNSNPKSFAFDTTFNNCFIRTSRKGNMLMYIFWSSIYSIF